MKCIVCIRIGVMLLRTGIRSFWGRGIARLSTFPGACVQIAVKKWQIICVYPLSTKRQVTCCVEWRCDHCKRSRYSQQYSIHWNRFFLSRSITTANKSSIYLHGFSALLWSLHAQSAPHVPFMPFIKKCTHRSLATQRMDGSEQRQKCVIQRMCRRNTHNEAEHLVTLGGVWTPQW